MNVQICLAKSNHFDICREFDSFNSDDVLSEKIDRGFVYLAMLDDVCIAYLRWDWFWNRIPYLCWIKVKENYQGKGVGYKLLKFFEAELKNRNHSFYISSAQESEPDAVAWHMKQGFKKIGSIETLNEDGSTEFFLRKDF